MRIGLDLSLTRLGGRGTPGLVLSALTIEEGAAAGTTVGTISASNGGTVTDLAITETSGDCFALDGSDIEAGATETDFETASSHLITVTGEIDGVATEANFTINVTNVLEVTLSALTLDNADFTEGDVAGTLIGAIENKSVGSTVTLTDSAGSKAALDGDNIEVGASAATEGAFNITLRETHADSSDSPKDSIIEITVNSAFDPLVALSGRLVGLYDASEDDSLLQAAAGSAAGDGEMVGQWKNLVSDALHWTQATDANKPLRHTDGAGHWWVEADGINDWLEVASSTTLFNFLHDGTGGEVVAAVRFEEPGDDAAGLIGNHAAASANTGFSFFHENRSSIPASDRLRFLIGKGSAVLVLTTGNDVIVPGTDQVVGCRYKNQAGDDGFIRHGATEVSVAQTASPSISGSSFSLRMFEVGNATFRSAMRVYALAIIDGDLTTQERTDLYAWMGA